MKLRAAIFACCVATSSVAQVFAQTIETRQDNTAVCHTPTATKAATTPARLIEGYGQVHMPITTKSEESQRFFDQGLALLHSFWGYEADRSFERAAQLDPECAMAQWGIAMAAVNEKRRDEAIKRAKELAVKASEREKLYVAAVEARYQGERATVQNNGFLGASEPYQKAMRKIVAFYPDDLEAKLFLALASMSGYERDGSPKPGTIEAIALLQVVLAKDPKHLAAHHYKINATESGKRAINGASSADIYGGLAPKVGHAVHMPGHTYVHIDRWDDAAKAFEASAQVDRAYIRENNETTDHAAGPYGHNLHFLATVYGYQGRYRDALRVSQELLDATKAPEEQKSRATLEGRISMLRALARFEKYDEILNGKSLPDDGEFEVLKAWRYYAQALANIGRLDLAAARAQLDMLEREIAWLKEKFGKAKDLPQAGRQRQQLRALAVAPIELKARLAAREATLRPLVQSTNVPSSGSPADQAKKEDEAISLLREGIEEEIKLGYSEPPLYPNPMEEVSGKVCLELKRWKEAEEFFRAALERDPGSGRAYFGLMQAQQALGKDAEARKSYAKFVKAWSKADADLPEMRRAKELAGTYSASGGN
ncbi:MAG TPA: tetratricopeptide repeat protein [Blastocatellia bacterium]|nr:tetratricopeptide repeat protein [Blastocatellia bacterium]